MHIRSEGPFLTNFGVHAHRSHSQSCKPASARTHLPIAGCSFRRYLKIVEQSDRCESLSASEFRRLWPQHTAARARTANHELIEQQSPLVSYRDCRYPTR